MPATTGTDIARAASLLRAGGLVAFATETVYGLGADALNPTAVAKVFAAKRRPAFDPLIVHIADWKWLGELTVSVPPTADRLMRRFWPGPLTLALPKTDRVPDLVTSGLPTVALRWPDHPQAQELLRAVNRPLAAPSANPFGHISPTTAAHVAEQLGEEVDYILDGGPCRVGLESTVLLVDGERVQLLRPGGVPREDIESLVGPIETGMTPAEETPLAPGMLTKHYAPRTPLTIIQSLKEIIVTPCGLLTFQPVRENPAEVVEVLSASGNLTEAAANFFAALRRLDALPLRRLYAFPFPDLGLGLALNDRLRRAAAK